VTGPVDKGASAPPFGSGAPRADEDLFLEPPVVPEDDDGGFSAISNYSPVPQVLGDYQIVSRLGGGSMADLYIAKKVSTFGFVHRAVIKQVKRSRTDYKQLQRMLLDEARATACFDHPNIVRLFDVGETDNGVYLALEYVEGTDLRRVNAKLRQRKEALPFELACFVVSEVLRGLHHAHTVQGADGKPLEIIHRDVNPSNVIIATSGHVKLADFGVVRMRERIQQKTEPGLVKGKYAYLAPEYIAGEPCSVQTDLYAAGIMLFELLSGRECFTGNTAYEVMWKIVNKGVPMYRLNREGVPEDLQRIVLRATAMVPERRYATAQDFANALEAWLMRSGRHATPWVLSVFFNRHELFPKGLEAAPPLRPLQRSVPAQIPKPTLRGDIQVEQREIQSEVQKSSQARQVDDSLTPAPDLDLEYPVPLLDEEPSPAPGDMWSRARRPGPPAASTSASDAPTPRPSQIVADDGWRTPSPSPPGDFEVPILAPDDQRTEAARAEPARGFEPHEVARELAEAATLQSLPPVRPDARGNGARNGDAGTPRFPPRSDSEAPRKVSPAEDLAPPAKPARAPEPPPPGAPIREGKLEDLPAAEVIARLTRQGESGVVEFRCGLIWKRVSIVAGRPTGITSNMGMELIGEHLVKARIISRADLEKALQASEREGTPLTMKLLENGALDQSTLEDELGRNLASRLQEVLEWRWGTYAFRPQSMEAPKILPRLDLAALLARARAKAGLADEEDDTSDDVDPDSPQDRLKEALRVARSIAKSTGKGRVDRPWRSTK
jgi:serine/threonine protein kinase